MAWDYLRAAMAARGRPARPSHESELRVDYPSGGQVRLYGADNPDAMRGIYLDGIVLDEYADMDPRVWSEIIRPALADRQGWAVFIGTPKGRNAFFELWRRSQTEDGWFSMMLKASETGLIPDERARARPARSDRRAIRAGVRMLVRRRDRRRLLRQADGCAPSRTSASPACPMIRPRWCGPSWDLGIRDATAIWFAQVIGREIRIIDYYEASGVDLGHYVREINARPYAYAGHIVPHDAQAQGARHRQEPARSAAKASGSRPSRSRRCTGSRTASTRCACSSRNAGSTQQKCARGHRRPQALPLRL